MNPGEAFNPYKLFTGVFIPTGIVASPHLSMGAKITYGRLARYAGQDGVCFPSVATLGEEIGVSDRQARTYLGELEDANLISREARYSGGAQTTNTITFLWHDLFDSDRGGSSFQPPLKSSSVPPLKSSSGQLRESVLRESEEESKTLPTLSDLPSEEKQEPPPAACPTLDNVDLESPIEDFVRNSLRVIARVKPPNLKTRAAQQIVDRLKYQEEMYEPWFYRVAFESWCAARHPWVVENKYPIAHFLKHVESHLPVSERNTSGARQEPRPAVERRPEVSAPPPSNSGSMNETPVVEKLKAEDFVLVWNGIVTDRPFLEAKVPRFPTPLPKIVDWTMACTKAKLIIAAKGPDASWLTMRWLLKSDEVKGDNYIRLSSGELDFMLKAEAPRGSSRAQAQQAIGLKSIEESKERIRLRKEQEKNQNADAQKS